MVAERNRAGTCPAGASGTVAAGGRQSGYGSRAGVAKNQLNKRLAFCFFPWHAADMPETWRYRGQEIVSEQIAFLREFIEAHPDSSRWKLSRQLCEALGWKQPNGALRDVVCRGLLLMLEPAGQIQLPPVRCHIRGQSRRERSRPPAFRIDTTPLAGERKCAGRCDTRGQSRSERPRPPAFRIDTAPLAMPLKSLGPIDIQLVRRTADEPLFHSLMEEHHYLGYEQPVGEHLKYLVRAQGRPVACLAW